MRKVTRGIPTCIKQYEWKSKKAHIETKGTKKKSVMKGNLKLTRPIRASVYENKPVHYIFMFSEELKWVVNDKECFNVDTGKVKN